jgi:hypothetical protein
MYVTVAFLWVSVWRFQDLWPIIGKLQVPILLEAAVGLALVVSIRGPRKLKWTRSRIFALPFILLAIMVIGGPFSLWRGNTLIFVTKVFMPSLLLMAGVIFSVRESEDLEWIAFGHLIGADAYAAWTYLFVSIGSDGRLEGSAHYDANDLALLLVATMPIAIYFLRPGVAVWKRLFALLSLGLYTMLMIKCGSRGGFIAFVVVLVYIVVAFRAIPTRLRLSAVGVIVLLMTVLGSTTYWNTMQTIMHPKDDYNMTSPVGRKAIWKRGVGYMLTHPVVGVGANTFEQAEGTLSAISQEYAALNKGLKWSTAHNSFVLVGAELGVTGLIVFVTMLGTSFAHLARIKAGPGGDPGITPADAAFAQALTASLIGFCVAGFFVSAAYFSFLYALIGLVIGVDSLGRRRRARAAAQPSVQPALAGAAPVRRTKQVPRAHWAPTG